MKRSTHNLKAVFIRRGGVFTGFEVSGHAGYGEAGNDIVCSAVSSAVMLVCNTVTDFFGAAADVTVEENCVTLRLKCADRPSEMLLDSFFTHMKDISEHYPGVKVEIREA